MNKYDVAVIGAGHNGLVCAAYLVKCGLRVVVLERSAQVGGACITEELVPGFRFSTFAYSAHGPGPRICADLEIPEDAFEVAVPDPQLVQLLESDRVVLWRDPERTEAELARFGKSEVDGFRRYQEFCRRARRICEEFFLTEPPDPVDLRSRWSSPEDRIVLDELLTGNLWNVISNCFTHEAVRLAFARADDVGPVHYAGSALAEFIEQASTGLGIRNEAGLVRQGMGRITEVLAELLRSFGGEIRENAPVRHIQVEHGKVRGVILESSEFVPADLTVSNADPKRTFLKLVLPGDLPESFRRQVENLKTRAGYMKFLAALSDFPRFRMLRHDEIDDPRYGAVARILPSFRAMESAWLESQTGKMPAHPILSLQLPTTYWPEQAPPGKHVFSAWIRWAPARLEDGSTWVAQRDAISDHIVRIIDRYAPGFSELILWRRLYTPADIEAQTGITDACIRHLDMTLDQMLHRRPLPGWSHYQSPLPGLWLCGSGTHPCGSVTGGPGYNCARSILRHLGRL